MAKKNKGGGDTDWDAKERRAKFCKASNSFFIQMLQKEDIGLKEISTLKEKIYDLALDEVRTAYTFFPNGGKGAIDPTKIPGQVQVFEDDVVKKYFEVKRDSRKDREIGRYWASDLAKMLHDWMKPKKFFDDELPDVTGQGNILRGIASEEMLVTILETVEMPFNADLLDDAPEDTIISEDDGQLKRVMEIDDEMTLTVKPDFYLEDEIIETKEPTKSTIMRYIAKGQIPYWYKPQLEAEHRAFKKDVYLGVFIDHPKNRFSLVKLPYTPSDELWEECMEALKEFHETLKEQER